MQQTKPITDFLAHLLATSTPVAPAWNIEQTRENKPTAWNYVDGCMIKAILDIYHATAEQKYFDFAKNYIDFYIQPDGTLLGYNVEDYNCDNINMGKVLFDLYDKTADPKYTQVIKLLYSQLEKQPRIKAGNFWHKQIYPNQVWLDGLYMVQPFYMAYEKTFGDGKNYDDILSQFKNVYSLMRDLQTNLLYHGYDESREMFWADKETGLSKNYWTRSIGWYTMALVDTAEKKEFPLFAEHLRSVAEGLLKVIDPASKMFFQVTNAADRQGNYLETSGTCAIAYSFMKGARLGYLPQNYFTTGEEIFNAVATHKLVTENNNFVLKDICLVAGLGGMPGKGDYQPRDGTFEYYISEPKVNNDAKGVAPFLFAYSELLRHN